MANLRCLLRILDKSCHVKQALMGMQNISRSHAAAALVLIIALGIFVRFFNIAEGVYWQDEAITSLRTSGYQIRDIVTDVYDGEETTVGALRRHLDIDPQKTISDTIRSLAAEDTQHPPLYYVLSRLWSETFGSSIAARRSISAVFGVLALPVVFWLCLELFGSALIGLVAAGLMAASPVFVAYSQQAREYTLWILLFLLSSVAYLKALKANTNAGWAWYSAAVTLAMYTFPLSVLFVLGHGITLLLTRGVRIDRATVSFAAAAGLAFVAFLPWVALAYLNRVHIESTLGWHQQPIALAILLKSWSWSFAQVILGSSFKAIFGASPVTIISGLIVLVFLICCLYIFWRKCDRQKSLFVFSLIATGTLPIWLWDIVHRMRYSTQLRYTLPAYVGVLLALAYDLVRGMAGAGIRRRRLWQAAAVCVLVVGVASSLLAAQDSGWYRAVGTIINRSPDAVVVSDADVGYTLPLAYYLDKAVRLLFVAQPEMPAIPETNGDVLILNAVNFSAFPPFRKLPLSESLPRRLQQRNGVLELLYEDSDVELWRLQKDGTGEPGGRRPEQGEAEVKQGGMR